MPAVCKKQNNYKPHPQEVLCLLLTKAFKKGNLLNQ